MRTLLPTVLLLAGAADLRAAPPAADGPALARKVLPVLKRKCMACHGDDPKKLLGGLDLRTREATLAGGDSGPAVVPGDPAKSLLYRAATRTDADVSAMPPKDNDKLATADVELIREWIAAGAPWPMAGGAVEAAAPDGTVAVATSGGLSADWTGRRYQPADLWAYQPRRRPSVPAGSAHPIDAFLAAKLVAAGLTPAPPADRRTLLRRVTFDLLGLPPTPEETTAFLADTDSDDKAYGRVIDRLLASPHHGEKWGRHWLDVARYADSSGFANDYERGNAWRYRDYVIRAFNSDKPYDRFVREQLAGDEIDPANPENLVAVGFLRAGAWELTGMEVPKVARQRFLDDVTDAVGQTFLAHPLQCCRCHDHKFDPVPTRDYYGIQAVFATTQLAERAAPFLPAENVAGSDEAKYLAARKARHEADLDRIRRAEAAGRAKWLAAHPDKKGEKPPRHEFLPAADLGLERIARKGLERLKWEADRTEPFALSVYAGRTPDRKAVYAPFRVPASRLTAGELETTCILAGGDPFSPKESVPPGVLSAVPGAAELPAGIEGRRKAFAQWVTRPANPLTARVMANRVWAWHFGRGLAGTPNNFGATGKKPTHPELLDWLAAEFVERGWSVKHLHRLILTSGAYRRSSAHPDPKRLAAKDSTGTLYAAFGPRRLTAEELRDGTLAVTGELNRAVGGVPVRPEIHPEAALQPRQVMGTFAPAWEPSPRPDQRHRRSVYALQLRGLRDPFAEVFNQPDPESTCDLRDTSTVTPQVFALFNSPRGYDRALAFAGRLLKEAKTREAAIDRAFHLALGRAPTVAEAAKCLAHWAAMTERHKGLTFDKPAYPTRVVREAVEENTGETFTFVEHLNVAADFVPDLKPHAAGPEVRGLAEVCLVLLNANEFVYID